MPNRNFSATQADGSATNSLAVRLDEIYGAGRDPSPLADRKPQLTLDFEEQCGVLVLRCDGRVLFWGRVLPTIVGEVLPTAKRMVLDLGKVESIDSGGLGELVLTHMWAEAAGYTLMFAAPKPLVRSLFEMTHLDSVFDVFESVAEAIEAMAQAEVQSA